MLHPICFHWVQEKQFNSSGVQRLLRENLEGVDDSQR